MQVSYPGVYIQEIPSGVRTITGVPTSITAFVGRASAGPENDPVVINSWADFERRFGGLAVDCTMSYAVRDFYTNDGSQAVIVRVAPADAESARITLGEGSPSDALILEASSPGEWGNRLSAWVDHPADGTGSPETQQFNLFVEFKVSDDPESEEVRLEQFLNVSVDPDDPRYVPRVLEHQSTLVIVPPGSPEVPSVRPPSNVSYSSPGHRQTIDRQRASGGRDGGDLADTDITGDEDRKTGIYALLKTDLFNLLCIPPPVRGRPGDPHTATSADVYQRALKLCVDRRAFLIVDPDPLWGENTDTAVPSAITGRDALGLAGQAARNGAIYFPCVREVDPLRDSQVYSFVPCGLVAGIMTRTDNNRGVWKAPAGLDAALNGVQGLQVNLNDLENGQLNRLGINCLRSFPVNGRVVWGARTLRGADQAADEYKYVPVRRLALYIEESLYRGTQWTVFEPNDEPLWAQIRLNVGAFMQNLFRQGAFQGRSPREAYLVKCDAETTTQNDINLGIVNVLVGFAPLKPAEFVIIRIQQLAGQVQA